MNGVFVIEDDETEVAAQPRKVETNTTEDASRCTVEEERRPCPCCRVLLVGCAMM